MFYIFKDPAFSTVHIYSGVSKSSFYPPPLFIKLFGKEIKWEKRKEGKGKVKGKGKGKVRKEKGEETRVES